MNIKGLCRCTKFTPPKEKLESSKILGPDEGWQLLSDAAVIAFCKDEGKNIIHRGKPTYDHVCSSFGAWAFDAEDSSYIRSVVFLHYNQPAKLKGIFGDDDNDSVFKFTGAELFKAYDDLKLTERHIWKRPSQGEIAIDFCLHKQRKIANNEPRFTDSLPTFAPPKKKHR